jgi:hypothetical protein
MMGKFVVRPLVTQPVRAWYEEKADIHLDPSYQRRSAVWSKHDKAFLIDSIINGYDLPKLYFADFTMIDSPLNEKRKKYAVIDGKQRLIAIFGFLENDFGLDPAFVLTDDPTVELSGLTYSDLLASYPRVAARVDNYILPVMSVVTDDEFRINDMFIRLNRGRALSGPELRNAMGGVVPVLLRDLVQHEFFQSRIAFPTQRMQDHNAAAKLLLFEFRGRPFETKKWVLDRLAEQGADAEASVTQFRRAASRVGKQLGRMSRVFVRRDVLLQTQGLVTVYYWLVRGLEDEELPRLRRFLVEFDRERARNRRIVRAGGAPEDPEVQRFENLNRSTNDQASIEERFEILLERFKRWSDS